MMHADELAIDEPLVRRLLAEQFPEWAGLPLERVEPSGTVNAIYRLGDELAVRLPRVVRWSLGDDRELEWLPRLAPLLPLAIPIPLAVGEPAEDYPCRWSVVTWLEGEHDAAEPVQAARDLAGFVEALHAVDPAGAPPGRGTSPIADYDASTRAAIAKLGNDPRVLAAWEDALAVPWDGVPVLHHADLDARNWLVRDGRLSAVIDWGSFGAGDPAWDVMAAWKLHSAEAVEVFRDVLRVDDATWARARGWAVAQSQWALSYYTLASNAPLVREATAWLELALAR
jgi:aminoglycoside phosphotransferase (APT) family kinase protein